MDTKLSDTAQLEKPQQERDHCDLPEFWMYEGIS